LVLHGSDFLQLFRGEGASLALVDADDLASELDGQFGRLGAEAADSLARALAMALSAAASC
jgi:hypothetical protein